jgi:hypothetical protein
MPSSISFLSEIISFKLLSKTLQKAYKIKNKFIKEINHMYFIQSHTYQELLLTVSQIELYDAKPN